MTGKKKPNGRNPKPWEPTAQQLLIYEKIIQGRHTYRELAKEFKLSKTVVGITFQKVNAWFVPQILADIKEEKARQVAELRNIFCEAMKAWDASKLDAVTRRVGDTAKGKIDVTETKGQCGDPKFLQVAINALRDIRRITGADAALRVEHSGSIRVAGRDPAEVRQEVFNRIRKMAGVTN